MQLVQPVLTISWAALLLGEHVGPVTLLGGLAVIGAAALAVRTRAGRTAAPRPDGRRKTSPRTPETQD